MVRFHAEFRARSLLPGTLFSRVHRGLRNRPRIAFSPIRRATLPFSPHFPLHPGGKAARKETVKEISTRGFRREEERHAESRASIFPDSPLSRRKLEVRFSFPSVCK